MLVKSVQCKVISKIYLCNDCVISNVIAHVLQCKHILRNSNGLGFCLQQKKQSKKQWQFCDVTGRQTSPTPRLFYRTCMIFSVLTGSSGFISQGLVKGTQPSLFPCLPRPKTSVNGLFSGVLRGWHINQWASVCHMVATSNLPFFLSKLFSNIGCKLNRAPSDRKDRWTW